MMTRREIIKLFLMAVSESKARNAPPPEPPPAFEGVLISDIEVDGEKLEQMEHPAAITLRRVPDGEREVFETNLAHRYGLSKVVPKYKYVVVSGEKRLLGLQQLGHGMIVCKVIQ